MMTPKPNMSFKLNNRLTKKDLFKKICKRLRQLDLISSETQVVNELMYRESLSDTRISEECAMPHCQSEAITDSKIIIVDCQDNPIGWKNKNDKVTKIIFLLLAVNDNKARLKEIRDFVRNLATGSFEFNDLASFEMLD